MAIWLALDWGRDKTGVLSWVTLPLWTALTGLFVVFGDLLLPAALRRWWFALFLRQAIATHGSAEFGTAAIGARHLGPAAPADAFVLGWLPDAPRRRDTRFRQDGHILTCAPTGAGKGIGAVIRTCWPIRVLLSCWTSRARTLPSRPGHDVNAGSTSSWLIPFGITGTASHALNWLDTLDRTRPMWSVAPAALPRC